GTLASCASTLSREGRGCRGGRCGRSFSSTAAAHVGPERFEILVADLVAPRRHRRRLAVEHRVAEPLGIVFGEFAQVERDAAGIDHVAPMAGHAEIVIDPPPLLDLGFARLGSGRKRWQKAYNGPDEQSSARGNCPPRHGRVCPGHPRLIRLTEAKTWIPGTRPGMTGNDSASHVASSYTFFCRSAAI